MAFKFNAFTLNLDYYYKAPTLPDEVVNFDQLTPTTPGVIFTPNEPALPSTIYTSTVDGSLWSYIDGSYVTYTPPAFESSTEWYINGTTIDAGGNKTAGIQRSGYLNVAEDSYFNNIRIGRGGGNVNTNTVVGKNAGLNNSTGAYNTFFGESAGYFNNASFNTFNGRFSGATNTTGSNNNFYGYASGLNNTSGSYNSFTGSQAGFNNTTGNYNVFLGFSSGFNNRAAGFNTFIGHESGFNNVSSEWNTFIGYRAGYTNTLGRELSGVGYASLYYNTSGWANTANGLNALFYNTTGNNNLADGRYAGMFIADGVTANTITNNSVFLGANTKALGNNQTNQTVIGYNAIGRGSNTVNLGNDAVTNTYLHGNVTINDAYTLPSVDGAANYVLKTDGAGVIGWTSVSNTTPDEVVNFDQLTPTTAGVVFDPNTPATQDILYISSVNASTWIWNGTAYVTYSAPTTASTEWYLTNTTIDAGSNKTASIERKGDVIIRNTTAPANFNIFSGSKRLQFKSDLATVNQIVSYSAELQINSFSNNLSLKTNNVERIKIASTGAVTFNNAFTFPTTSGTTGQVLVTNGTGVVNWGTVSYIRRHETTSNYDYLGSAISGTNESATTWKLTRLTLDSSGISSVTHAIDSWVNRATATYI